MRAVAKELGRAAVVVSHDGRIQELADRILWLEDGRFKDNPGLAVASAEEKTTGV